MASPATGYPEEFKLEAVSLYRSGQYGGLEKTAQAFGIGRGSLRRWALQAGIDAGAAGGLTTEEKAELFRLRRENMPLKEDREILKKAAAFFVRETDRAR